MFHWSEEGCLIKPFYIVKMLILDIMTSISDADLYWFPPIGKSVSFSECRQSKMRTNTKLNPFVTPSLRWDTLFRAKWSCHCTIPGAPKSVASFRLDTKLWKHPPFGQVTLKMYLPTPVFTRQKVYAHLPVLAIFKFYYFYYEIDSIL